MTRLLALPLLVALALALAACGDDAGTGGAAAAPRTALQLSFWIEGTGGGEAPVQSTVTCADDATDADCAALLAVTDAVWAPVPADAPCTKIYGGPGVMRVSGTVDGRPVDSTFTRSGGCEIRRWDAVVPLLRRMAVPASGTPTATVVTTREPPPSGPTELRLVWFPKGPDVPADRRVLTVTCPEIPADTDKDCQELLDAAQTDLFAAELPPGTVCTEIYGGPQTLRVTGTLSGRRIDTTFSRTDGCQIERWDRAAALLLRMGRP